MGKDTRTPNRYDRALDDMDQRRRQLIRERDAASRGSQARADIQADLDALVAERRSYENNLDDIRTADARRGVKRVLAGWAVTAGAGSWVWVTDAHPYWWIAVAVMGLVSLLLLGSEN